MIARSSPTPVAVDRYLQRQSLLPFSYSAHGATRTPEQVAGFNNDYLRTRIGRGEADFERAKLAVTRWRMFPDTWTLLLPVGAPVSEQTCVAMYARVFGFWWRNACRIVYRVDEPRRFGFAYGTLPGHMEKGEELFCVELDDEGGVWYEIRAFSRPRHLLAWLGYPFVRYLQDRFRRDSAAQMHSFVKSTD